MATVPSPRTWAVGELLTAAKLNTDLRDGMNFLLAPPLAVLTRSTAQSIPHVTDTPVAWNTETLDRDGGHDNVTNNTRYTVQTAGWYAITANMAWLGSTTGYRRVWTKKNGVNTILAMNERETNFGDLRGWQTLGHEELLTVGDYIETMVSQNTGAALDLQPFAHLTIRWFST